MTFWLRGHVTNLKNLYLPLRNIYGLQTWQSSNLRWTDPIFKVTWPFNCMVTWQMKKTYIYTSTIPMAIKLGRVVTYGQKTPHIKSRYFLIKWSREKCKTWYLHFCNIYNHQTWQSGNLHWKDPSFKAMWSRDKWTSTILLATKLGRVQTYDQKTLQTKLHDILISLSRDKYKTL